MKRIFYIAGALILVAGLIGIIIHFASLNRSPADEYLIEHPYRFSSEEKSIGTEYRESYVQQGGCIFLSYPKTGNQETDQKIQLFLQEAKDDYDSFAAQEESETVTIPQLVFNYSIGSFDPYNALQLHYSIGRYQPDGTGDDSIQKDQFYYLGSDQDILNLDGVLGANTEKKLNIMLQNSGKSTDNLEDFCIQDNQVVLRWSDSTEAFGIKEVQQASVIDPSKPMIALTFDDGPGKYSRKFADLLTQYNGHGTFFVLGINATTFSESLKYVYDAGNEIGSHTMHHLNLNKLTEAQIKAEITDADAVIEGITGEKPTMIRTPYGNTKEAVLQLLDRPMIKWNVDTLDWKSRNAEAVKKEILKHAKDGNIVLMHEVYESTYEGLSVAMQELSAEGYQFVTVSELMMYRGVTPVSGQVYCSIPPA